MTPTEFQIIMTVALIGLVAFAWTMHKNAYIEEN
jgi:hypothetical protein